MYNSHELLKHLRQTFLLQGHYGVDEYRVPPPAPRGDGHLREGVSSE